MNIHTKFNTLFEESKNKSDSELSSSDASNVHILLDSDMEINTPNLSSVEKPAYRKGKIPRKISMNKVRSKSSGKVQPKQVPRISETLSAT